MLCTSPTTVGTVTRATPLLNSGSRGELVGEAFEAAGALAAEGVVGPVGVEADDVDCGGGEGVLEADLGQPR